MTFDDRREFMSQMSVLSAALAASSLTACRRPDERPATRPSSRAIDLGQHRTLEAVVDRIVPEDAEPGAQAAGCADFIVLQMEQVQFKALAGMLARGLTWLDAMARKKGAAFADSDEKRQDELLGTMPSLRQRGLDGRRFMHLLVVLTLEGFLSDPRHGGNRNRVGWRFAGFEPVRWGDGAESTRVTRP